MIDQNLAFAEDKQKAVMRYLMEETHLNLMISLKMTQQERILAHCRMDQDNFGTYKVLN